MLSRLHSRALFVCILVFSTSCSNEQRLARGKPLRNINPNQVLEGFEANQIPWEWLGMKIDASVETANGVDSFKASIRMAKDSAIWISISPALGVEVARILLEPDSVRLLSKIPGIAFIMPAIMSPSANGQTPNCPSQISRIS